ncbi:uncharacterized protein [Cicer arietinum]|uniref:uncharacterized protein n=1 Tax=Cicer arietinum TaxID=3827 RepID=UPI003CC55C55
MEENENVADFFNRVQAVKNQMKANGEMIIELVMIEKILRTLTKMYDHIVVAIEESNDLNTIKLENLQSSLDAHELRIKEINENHTQAQALQAQTSNKSNQDGGKYKKGKGKSKWHKKQDIDESEVAESSKNQNNSSCNITDKGRNKFNKKGIQCYNCQKWVHFADECRSKKVKRDIIFVDNSYVIAEGAGKVLIQRKDGKQSFICDVLYVPNMKNNMLSLGQLLENGYSMNIENGQMNMFDRSKRLVLKALLSKNKTFKIEIQVNENQCLAVETRNASWLWHQRYRQLNYRSLQMFQNRSTVLGILDIQMPQEICEE